MFIWDFVLGNVLEQLVDWIYGQAVGLLGDFFATMGNMGVELFEIGWIQSIVLFFSYLAWALFGIGLVVAGFEVGIQYQYGRSSLKDTALNVLKGFLATSLVTVAPVELFKLSVNLQRSLSAGLTGYGQSLGDLAGSIISGLGSTTDAAATAAPDLLGGLVSATTSPIMLLLIVILMGYSIIKVFFGNLKRGGILLIQIAVGSLYMFSIPRGYIDGFMRWCKQVIGLCLTAFLQATLLTVGLLILKDHALLGLGVMLSAGEVPRIADAFGLDTSTMASLSAAVNTASTAINTSKMITQVVAK